MLHHHGRPRVLFVPAYTLHSTQVLKLHGQHLLYLLATFLYIIIIIVLKHAAVSLGDLIEMRYGSMSLG